MCGAAREILADVGHGFFDNLSLLVDNMELLIFWEMLWLEQFTDRRELVLIRAHGHHGLFHILNPFFRINGKEFATPIDLYDFV